MKNILQKLHAIMEAVDFIEKDKTNDFHRYKYASELAIKLALHKELVKNKVIFQVSVTDNQNTPVTTSKGNQEILTILKIHYTFHDVESGEMLEGDFTGSGQDSADKGTYKAITGAIKYILTSTFLIPTGDDPENDTVERVIPVEDPFAGVPVASEMNECIVCKKPCKKPFLKCFSCKQASK